MGSFRNIPETMEDYIKRIDLRASDAERLSKSLSIRINILILLCAVLIGLVVKIWLLN